MSIFVPDSNANAVNISCFSNNLVSTYILLVSSLFSIGVVVVTVILLQVKSVDDIIYFVLYISLQL